MNEQSERAIVHSYDRTLTWRTWRGVDVVFFFFFILFVVLVVLVVFAMFVVFVVFLRPKNLANTDGLETASSSSAARSTSWRPEVETFSCMLAVITEIWEFVK